MGKLPAGLVFLVNTKTIQMHAPLGISNMIELLIDYIDQPHQYGSGPLLAFRIPNSRDIFPTKNWNPPPSMHGQVITRQAGSCSVLQSGREKHGRAFFDRVRATKGGKQQSN